MEKITKDSKMEAEKYSVYRDEIKKGVSSLEEIKKNLKTEKSKLEARGNEKKSSNLKEEKSEKLARGEKRTSSNDVNKNEVKRKKIYLIFYTWQVGLGFDS